MGYGIARPCSGAGDRRRQRDRVSPNGLARSASRYTSLRGTSALEADVTDRHGSSDAASTAELLAGYARTLDILRARGVLRTANPPAGDFAEWLVWSAFGGTLEPNSTKSHDVTDAAGRKLQVKARLVSNPSTPGQLQTS